MKPRLPQQILGWINDRFPLKAMIDASLHERIPGGTRFSYTLGSSCLFLFILQALTGVWQMFFYVPTVDYAYSSLNYLRFEVPFGWLIHGLHYWGAHAFTIIVGLHVIRVFIWGAYKKPRELIWLAGVFLIIWTAMFMFTGPVLPWDKKGYWAAQVGLNMAGSAPWFGPFMQELLQGSSKLGQIALTRLYVIHVALLPLITVVFVVIHLVAFRVHGSIGPWSEKGKRKPAGEFWPEQLFKDAIIWLAISLLLVGLAAFCPAPLSGLADPMDTLYTPKPEWTFFFLYECLKYFSGPLEPIGTVGIPLMIILLLVSLPFVDRSPERDPARRGFVLLCGAVFVGFVIYMTLQGYYGNPPQDEQARTRLKMMKETDQSIAIKGPAGFSGGVRPMKTLPPQPLPGEENISGEKLFRQMGCAVCHSVNGKPSNKQGPDLKMVLNKDIPREWIWVQLIAPEHHNPHSVMPGYGHLSDYKLNALIDYVQSLVADKKETSQDQAIMAGAKLFQSLGCIECHTTSGVPSHKKGPDLVTALSERRISPEWLYAQISNPQKHNLSTIMPAHDRLDDHQLKVLVAFLERLAIQNEPQSKSREKAGAEETSPETADQKSATTPPDSGETDTESGSEKEQGTDTKLGLGASIHIVGNQEHGIVLFQQYCMRCHGPEGKVNPSDVSVLPGVPSIHPVRPELFSKNPTEFVRNIDPMIQHGVKNTGKILDMPTFGDNHELTQAQIADIEAYILHLNGVERTEIITPGVEPKKFFYIVLILSIICAVILRIYAWMVK